MTHTKVRLVKIDVEGAELGALAGMSRNISTAASVYSSGGIRRFNRRRGMRPERYLNF